MLFLKNFKGRPTKTDSIHAFFSCYLDKLKKAINTEDPHLLQFTTTATIDS